MQINGSNSNSLFLQPNTARKTNESSAVTIEATPTTASYVPAIPRQTSLIAKSDNATEQARYVRIFASQARNASEESVQTEMAQPTAIVEYQKVDNISLNVLGRVIDEVV